MNSSSHRSIFPGRLTKAHMRNLLSVAVAVSLSCFFVGYGFAAQDSTSMQTAERWDDIATIRLEMARDHETQAENVFQDKTANSLDTGDLLDRAGDEKFLAAENYLMASQQWDKAARAYLAAGASTEARKARENLGFTQASAKRSLSDGIVFHMKAKEQFELSKNLGKKTIALDKVARNLERLMEMK
jgi:hypothetical protein